MKTKIGAILVDADAGQILFEDHSDIKGYPASPAWMNPEKTR